MSKDVFDRGFEIRKKVLGAEFVEKSSRRRTIQPADAGTRHRILLGRGLGPGRAAPQDAQHAQHRDAELPQPAARTQDAPQGCVRTASPATRSARSSCRSRSMRACRPGVDSFRDRARSLHESTPASRRRPARRRAEQMSMHTYEMLIDGDGSRPRAARPSRPRIPISAPHGRSFPCRGRRCRPGGLGRPQGVPQPGLARADRRRRAAICCVGWPI